MKSSLNGVLNDCMHICMCWSSLPSLHISHCFDGLEVLERIFGNLRTTGDELPSGDKAWIHCIRSHILLVRFQFTIYVKHATAITIIVRGSDYSPASELLSRVKIQ